MLCPYCLREVRFRREALQEATGTVYVCPNPNCSEVAPTVYVRDYKAYPPVVVSVVGHRRHGKTVAIASLFYTMMKLGVSDYWPDFYIFPLNEDSLENVYQNVEMLDRGTLPDASPKIFPRPTMVHLSGVPFQRNTTLLFYDTAGEAFVRASQLGRYAGFVHRARTALFLISLPRILEDEKDPAGEMERLLYPYVQAMADLGDIDRQHLVVVFTCGDELVPLLGGYPDLHRYLVEGTVDRIARHRAYARRMWDTSERLRAFVRDDLQATQFLNLADDQFASVDFSIISALGAAPQGDGLAAEITPRRIFDPLLWMMERTQPAWKQAWRRWRWT